VTPPSTPGPPHSSGREGYRAVVLLFALVVGAYLVYQASQVVLTLLLALLLAVIASAPVDLLARRGVGRAKATVLVVGVVGLALWLGWVLVAPTLSPPFWRTRRR